MTYLGILTGLRKIQTARWRYVNNVEISQHNWSCHKRVLCTTRVSNRIPVPELICYSKYTTVFLYQKK